VIVLIGLKAPHHDGAFGISHPQRDALFGVTEADALFLIEAEPRIDALKVNFKIAFWSEA
jgi:hypothetical protein